MCKVYSKTSSITLQVISIEYFIKQFKKFSHGNSADLKEYVSARYLFAKSIVLERPPHALILDDVFKEFLELSTPF